MIKLNLNIGPIKADLNIDPRNGSVTDPKVTVKPKRKTKRKSKPSLNIRL